MDNAIDSMGTNIAFPMAKAILPSAKCLYLAPTPFQLPPPLQTVNKKK